MDLARYAAETLVVLPERIPPRVFPSGSTIAVDRERISRAQILTGV
jgi:hypothetical protein